MKATEIEDNETILLETGQIGMVIRVGGSRNEIGVQVPGEEDIRWIPLDEVVRIGGPPGALLELGRA